MPNIFLLSKLKIISEVRDRQNRNFMATFLYKTYASVAQSTRYGPAFADPWVVAVWELENIFSEASPFYLTFKSVNLTIFFSKIKRYNGNFLEDPLLSRPLLARLLFWDCALPVSDFREFEVVSRSYFEFNSVMNSFACSIKSSMVLVSPRKARTDWVKWTTFQG